MITTINEFKKFNESNNDNIVVGTEILFKTGTKNNMFSGRGGYVVSITGDEVLLNMHDNNNDPKMYQTFTLQYLHQLIDNNEAYIKPINEDIAESHEERFNRAIYLHYVESRQDNKFKHITKDEFYAQLYSIVDHRKTVNFDKNIIYRLADHKEIWTSKYNKVLGEIWREDGIESYWINISKY